MAQHVYDEHTAFYLRFVDDAVADDASLANVLARLMEATLRERLARARVCDLACGEGYLSRRLARLGVEEVVGVDLSANLIAVARERNDSPATTFRVDDVQRLDSFSDAVFDVAVSQMAVMDIPDHAAMFSAVRRVLRPGGAFAFSMLHPCFEAPFYEPDAPPLVLDEERHPVGRVIRRYATEGFWHSGGTGVRGHMGAYHRTLSTVLNDLLAAGFALREIREPVLSGDGLVAEVPQVLFVVAEAS